MIRLSKEYNAVLWSFYHRRNPVFKDWEVYASELNNDGYLRDNYSNDSLKFKITIKGISYLMNKRYTDVTYYLSLFVSVISLFISALLLLVQLRLLG